MKSDTMGKFTEHLIAGLALASLGLWHTFNTVRAYYSNGSSKFMSRTWYPFKSPLRKLENLELILILSFSILSIFTQILDLKLMHFSFKLQNFEHATMFLHLSIFAGFTLFAEFSNLSEILHSVSGVLASSVFAQELFLLHHHSTNHHGIEGHYHWLFELIVCISFLSAAVATISPTNFPSSLVLSISIILQGCWFMIMALMLWVPSFVPQGCIPLLVGHGSGSGSIRHGAVICESPEADFRARALANLQLSWIISAVLFFVAALCLAMARSPTFRGLSSTDYEQLSSRVADVPLSVTAFKQSRP